MMRKEITEKRESFASAQDEKNKNLELDGDTEMTKGEAQKIIDDALKPVQESNETLKQENEDLKKRLDEVEKMSKGLALLSCLVDLLIKLIKFILWFKIILEQFFIT